MVFESTVLRKILGLKKDERTGECVARSFMVCIL
jgi:hypothetical protein